MNIEASTSTQTNKQLAELPSPANKQYYYAKIDAGNRGATTWLAGDNPLKRPAIPVYFDSRSEAEYREIIDKLKTVGPEGLRRRAFEGVSTQALAFVSASTSIADRTLIVVMYGGRICLLKPAGAVKFFPVGCQGGNATCTTKAMPIAKLVDVNLADVPAVLAGLPADQYLSRGTFRPITHWGNLKAIDVVLERHVGIEPTRSAEHWQRDQHAAQLLECLGSTGLETLVARVLEDAGCFVPARTGGVLRDIDLFAHNDSDTPMTISAADQNHGEIRIPARGSITIQVKSWPSGTDKFKSPIVDYLIGLDVKGPGSLSAEWLLKAAVGRPPVRTWLTRSLEWLPTWFLKRFSLKPSE
jgi:hypothetical protein